jgi:predicted metal-binding protein
MASSRRGLKQNSLAEYAKEQGASGAKLISTKDVRVDKRVRLKCIVPRCSGYGTNLMCPPNVMSVDEFTEILGLYHNAILVQVEADADSSDKSSHSLDLQLCEDIEKSTNSSKWQRKLLTLVKRVETEAFKQGFYLAAGLSGGECCLCRVCVQPKSGQNCRHPFEARPSMEAMGIDVIRTCENAGMPVNLSSKRRVKWTGLVLLD